MLEFEWDSEKADRNIRKHNVSFYEAATAFSDPLSITFPDPDHSDRENRFITVGSSERGNILIVSHTNRGGIIRIISARITTRSERIYYEEGRI